MNENAHSGPVLDYDRLHQSMWPLVAVLTICSLFALLWGGAATGGAGYGALAMTGGLGLVLTPLFGLAFGHAGLKRSLKRGIAENQVTVLPNDHPLTVETHRLGALLGLRARPLVGTMPAHNAYAIGSSPEDSMVVIGTPLLEQLTPEEVSAVIAHELGHIANNDMRRMGLARSFQKSLTWYLGKFERLQRAARWGLSWMTELAVLRLSRKREYWADAIGATLVSPEAMRSALRKVCNSSAPLTAYESANARMMFRGKGSSILSTHPTLAEREAALSGGEFIRKLPHLARALPSPAATVRPRIQPLPAPVQPRPLPDATQRPTPAGVSAADMAY